MENQRMIQSVNDLNDKEITYRAMLGRYKTAIKYGFYLEAILIDYAMLEDRMRSFIYHAGALSDRGAKRVSGPGKKYISAIVKQFNPNENLGITRMSGKRTIIRSILQWEESISDPSADRYLKTLRSRIEELDVGGLLQMLDDSEEWCKYRNECIHSVMNKNLESLEGGIAAKSMEGMEYARFLDSQVKILKRGNTVRKSIRLSNK